MEAIFSTDKLLLYLGVFLAVCLIVIIAIMLDLWDAVYTANRTNQRVHSHPCLEGCITQPSQRVAREISRRQNLTPKKNTMDSYK